jgi:hypothetical protein
VRSPIFELVQRFVAWWTILSLVLIGTGVVDWMHRIGHACAASACASSAAHQACCSTTSDCHVEASELLCDRDGGESGCQTHCETECTTAGSSDAQEAEDHHRGCGDHACGADAPEGDQPCADACHGGDAHDEPACHLADATSNGAETSPSSHEEHSCPICLTLASLAAVTSAIIDDTTPIARLVGVTMVAADIAPSPAPLEAVEARPPPAGSLLT